VAWRSPRVPGRRTRRLPVGDDIDRINEIANGLAAASLALQAGDDEAAQQAVTETLAKTSTYLSAAVSATQQRGRRRRRATWTAGATIAAVAGAGVIATAPNIASPGDGDDAHWPLAAGMWADGPVLAIVPPDPGDVGLPGLPDDAKLTRRTVGTEPPGAASASAVIGSVPSEPTVPAAPSAEPQSTHPSDGRSERAETSGNAKPDGPKNENGGPKDRPRSGRA
jgi:hypothetical protein